MTRQLSTDEKFILKTVYDASGPGGLGATGSDLAQAYHRAGVDTTTSACHQAAAKLVSQGLISRAGTARLQWYTITHEGRMTVRGDLSSEQVTR